MVKKLIVCLAILLLLSPSLVQAQRIYPSLPVGGLNKESEEQALKIFIEMMLMYKLLEQPTMIASEGGTIVLFGNKMSKYDKDLNLIKEVNLNIDIKNMQQMVSKVADSYSNEVIKTMGGVATSSSSSRIMANDVLAKATLRSISTAAESFATANSGNYPNSSVDLTLANPPYLNKNYCDQEIAGYVYSCSFNATSYKITASPSKIGETGTAVMSVTTGGVLQ